VVVSRHQQTAADGGRGVRVDASVVSSGAVGPHDLAREPLTERVAKAAYAEAGVTPDDLGVVELHDAFSIAELLYYEALGLCGYGEAPDLLRDGVTETTGTCPVNAGGGLSRAVILSVPAAWRRSSRWSTTCADQRNSSLIAPTWG
jgi:acetyl-CoA acetyltransferase